MKNVAIVYSSVGGNTKLVCDAVAQVFAAKNFRIEVKPCQITTIDDLKSLDLIILACPTYGQGTVESDFAVFLKMISAENWNQKLFTVIGLGDTKYYPEYLTESAGLLSQWVEKQNGILLGRPLRIGKPPLSIIETMVVKWAENIANQLNTNIN